jgi:hypothetical protein
MADLGCSIGAAQFIDIIRRLSGGGGGGGDLSSLEGASTYLSLFSRNAAAPAFGQTEIVTHSHGQ